MLIADSRPTLRGNPLARANHLLISPGDRVLLTQGEAGANSFVLPLPARSTLPITFFELCVGHAAILEGDSGRVPQEMHGLRRRPQRSAQAVYEPSTITTRATLFTTASNSIMCWKAYGFTSGPPPCGDITLRNCQIQVDGSYPGGPSSAAVYAKVRKGSITDLRILQNHVIPYPRGPRTPGNLSGGAASSTSRLTAIRWDPQERTESRFGIRHTE